jgi:hypothetical protein
MPESIKNGQNPDKTLVDSHQCKHCHPRTKFHTGKKSEAAEVLMLRAWGVDFRAPWTASADILAATFQVQ